MKFSYNLLAARRSRKVMSYGFSGSLAIKAQTGRKHMMAILDACSGTSIPARHAHDVSRRHPPTFDMNFFETCW